MKERYKIYTIINGEETIFKRWGESDKEVKQDLENHIKSAFETTNYHIVNVEKDASHTVNIEPKKK